MGGDFEVLTLLYEELEEILNLLWWVETNPYLGGRDSNPSLESRDKEKDEKIYLKVHGDINPLLGKGVIIINHTYIAIYIILAPNQEEKTDGH